MTTDFIIKRIFKNTIIKLPDAKKQKTKKHSSYSLSKFEVLSYPSVSLPEYFQSISTAAM